MPDFRSLMLEKEQGFGGRLTAIGVGIWMQDTSCRVPDALYWINKFGRRFVNQWR
jgi:hypothetical protein